MHPMEHIPEQISKRYGLRSYAPDVPQELLQLLSSSFTELRSLVEAGKLSYPYSTRELVNLVRHLQQFPEDALGEVIETWITWMSTSMFLGDGFGLQWSHLRDKHEQVSFSLVFHQWHF